MRNSLAAGGIDAVVAHDLSLFPNPTPLIPRSHDHHSVLTDPGRQSYTVEMLIAGPSLLLGSLVSPFIALLVHRTQIPGGGSTRGTGGRWWSRLVDNGGCRWPPSDQQQAPHNSPFSVLVFPSPSHMFDFALPFFDLVKIWVSP